MTHIIPEQGRQPIKRPPAYTWMHPKLVVKSTSRYGLGVFTRSPLRRGTILFVMGGHIIDTRAEIRLGRLATDYGMDIAEDFAFAPRTHGDLRRMPQLLVNHSCAPNAGFRSSQFMVAIRSIPAGEEICYDYAFVMWRSRQSKRHFRLCCACGAPSCRSIITEDDWKRPDIQSKYLGYFQWFLQEKIGRLNKQRRAIRQSARPPGA